MKTALAALVAIELVTMWRLARLERGARARQREEDRQRAAQEELDRVGREMAADPARRAPLFDASAGPAASATDAVERVVRRLPRGVRRAGS